MHAAEGVPSWSLGCLPWAPSGVPETGTAGGTAGAPLRSPPPGAGTQPSRGPFWVCPLLGSGCWWGRRGRAPLLSGCPHPCLQTHTGTLSGSEGWSPPFWPVPREDGCPRPAPSGPSPHRDLSRVLRPLPRDWAPPGPQAVSAGACACVCACACMCACAHRCACACAQVSVCAHVCTCVFARVYMRVCAHAHTRARLWGLGGPASDFLPFPSGPRDGRG